MLRRMLSDSVSSTTATNVGSANAYKRLPSRERALTEIHVERMNSDSGAGLSTSRSRGCAVVETLFGVGLWLIWFRCTVKMAVLCED